MLCTALKLKRACRTNCYGRAKLTNLVAGIKQLYFTWYNGNHHCLAVPELCVMEISQMSLSELLNFCSVFSFFISVKQVHRISSAIKGSLTRDFQLQVFSVSVLVQFRIWHWNTLHGQPTWGKYNKKYKWSGQGWSSLKAVFVPIYVW